MDTKKGFFDDDDDRIPFNEDLAKVLGQRSDLYPFPKEVVSGKDMDNNPVIGEGALVDWLRSLAPEDVDKIDAGLGALEKDLDTLGDGIINACDTLDAALDDFQDWIDSL